MQVALTTFTIAEYCEQMLRKSIIVNREYQRSPRVWPPAARSYLIETILLGYPVPKLSLYQMTDVKTRQTIKEIVDGQQRSQAILDFYSDRLRLTGKSEFAGRTYSRLETHNQQRFLQYQLSIDLFVGATASDIRQVFRRINSYTVPLNPQEKRHATFQGEFKWFIVSMTEKYAQALKDVGVFSEQQLSRMNDAALLSEIVYALINGIQSASESKLDDLYRTHDADFDEENYGRMLDTVFAKILAWLDTHKGPLMRAYNFYTLALAIIHVTLGPNDALTPVYGAVEAREIQDEVALVNLGLLADAIENPREHQDLGEFIDACSKATNRIHQRQTRFHWFCRALTQPTLP